VFRCVWRAGKTWGNGVTERVVWDVVKDCAKRAAIENLAPHDLRRYAESPNMPNTVSGDAPAGRTTLNDSA
jgi:hypothetical protein